MWKDLQSADQVGAHQTILYQIKYSSGKLCCIILTNLFHEYSNFTKMDSKVY